MCHPKRCRLALFSLFASLALVAAACSSTGSKSDSQVRYFSEIQASGFEFTVDENGVAKMTVTTDVEAACSIAWGEDENLGFLHTDLDMAGGAHQKHEVILVGAEPGKTYSFHVQGATPDGSLFQSPLSTFTLPEAPMGGDDAMEGGDTMAQHGSNLAEEATVTAVSSMLSPSWSGDNAIDGNTATEWATAGNGDDAFIEVRAFAPVGG